MSLIVEDGSGVLKANSYVGLAYAESYLFDRERTENTDWSNSTRAQKEAALIKATDYIDKRFGRKFLGSPLHTDLAVPAKNLLIVTALPAVNDTITFNESTYTFKASSGGPTEITIGDTVAECASNIVTIANAQTDMNFSSSWSIVYIESAVAEDVDYSTSSTSDSLAFDSATLMGGSVSSGVQPLCFPRTLFTGIPEILKMATVEYAVRSLAQDLMPDPSTDETGGIVNRKYEKVGPIEEETQYETYNGVTYRRYPEADYLMKDLVSAGSGVYR